LAGAEGGTVNRKGLILGMMLFLAGCTAAAGQPCAVSCAAPTPENRRTISVTGEGKVNVAPDIAVMYLSVVTRNADINAAWDDNNARTETVLAAIRGQGVEEADIRSDLSLYQQEKYDPSGQPSGEITFIVTHSLTVVVRDLAQVGVVLGVAQGAGINSIGGVTFSLEDPSPALSQARSLAVADARSRAEEIAKELGVTLGKVLTVNEYGGSAPAPMDKSNTLALGGGGSSVPIQAGTWVVRMTVGVVFEIE
jgi:uncharacterized protein YggE